MDLLPKLRERALTQALSVFVQENQGLYLYGRMPSLEALGFKTRLASPTGARDSAETRTVAEA